MLRRRRLLSMATVGISAPLWTPYASTSKLIPPSQAIAAGYTTSVFDDDFATLNLGTSFGIHNWYTEYESGRFTDPRFISVSPSVAAGGSGVLVLNSDTSGWGATIQSAPDHSGIRGSVNYAANSRPGRIRSNVGNGVVYKFGYFEASLQLDPTSYAGGLNGDGKLPWPAFWLGAYMPSVAPGADWPEIDIAEFQPHDWYPNGALPHTHCDNTATLHEWSDRDHKSSGFKVVGDSPSTWNEINWKVFNTWGCLWTPKAVSIFLNDQLQDTMSIGPVTKFTAAADYYVYVILGTGIKQQFNVDWVRIWQ